MNESKEQRDREHRTRVKRILGTLAIASLMVFAAVVWLVSEFGSG